jgi:hypothetical protein
MASITSSVSGSTTTYTITDVAGNTATVTAPGTGAFWKAASVTVSAVGGLLADGIAVLNNLLGMLNTNLRPNVIPGTNSFSN